MPAKSLRQQAFAPRSGRFSGSRAARKSRYCEGVEKVRRTFSTAWETDLSVSVFFSILKQKRVTTGVSPVSEAGYLLSKERITCPHRGKCQRGDRNACCSCKTPFQYENE